MQQKHRQNGLNVTILSGDRDTFQLATDKITIRIPRTKMGKTEEDDYNRDKVIEQYGIEPEQLIEVKGLMGDKSDNIPGIAGIGEKTALNIIKKYKTIEKLYKELEKGKAEDIKGKLREKLIEGKNEALLSKELGTINVNSPIDEKIEELETKEWDRDKVLELFKKLRFNKYIDRFSLIDNEEINPLDTIDIKEGLENEQIEKLKNLIKKEKQIIYYLDTKEDDNRDKIIKRKICSLSIIMDKEVYYINDLNTIINDFKDIFEDEKIEKIGYKLKQDYILLKEYSIELKGFKYDAEIAGYILDSIKNRYDIETLSLRYLNLEISRYIKKEEQQEQLNLFNMQEKQEDKTEKNKNILYVYCISQLYPVTMKYIEEQGQLELFNTIEMPTSRVLAKMQYNGIYINKEELIEYGRNLKLEIEEKTQKIYNLCGQEFNINSTKQLGKVLFEDLKLPVQKKKKSGYSTDVEVLEKLREEHPVIDEILDYRQLVKLNSTYVEGMLPYINSKTNRIHSFFHQTVTATRKNKQYRTKPSKYTNKV